MRRSPIQALGFALALALAPALRAQETRPSDTPTRESFEELLARVRAQREANQAKLGGDVRDRVARLEPSERLARPGELERALSDVVALGGEAVPLLVPYLEPGPNAADAVVQRARRVADALVRMDTAAALEGLLAALTTWTSEGRINALRVLETTKEPERVRPVVLEAFRSSHGALKSAALRALFTLGAGDDPTFVQEVLLGDDPELTRLSLRALAESRQSGLLDAVERLAGDAKRVAPLVRELAEYLEAVSGSLREKDVVAFARLATMPELEVERRVLVLDALPRLADKLFPDLKKVLERAGEARDRKVKEGALVARVCLGDKSARKDLLGEYDERIKKNERWAPAWGERADVLYRIRDFEASAKDFTTAIAVGKNDPTPRPDYYVGAAKCYAMLGRLKDAAEWLERAPITLDELKSLASNPVFAKLREHSKYGAVFGDK